MPSKSDQKEEFVDHVDPLESRTSARGWKIRVPLPPRCDDKLRDFHREGGGGQFRRSKQQRTHEERKKKKEKTTEERERKKWKRRKKKGDDSSGEEFREYNKIKPVFKFVER